VSRAYGAITPDPIENMVENAGDNLGAPADAINHETLGKWGIGEGAYLEIPLLGPSTARNATGRVVDFFIDPIGVFITSPESDYVLGAKALDIVDGRHRYEQLIDQTLYESVDSYSATRTGYHGCRKTRCGKTDF